MKAAVVVPCAKAQSTRELLERYGFWDKTRKLLKRPDNKVLIPIIITTDLTLPHHHLPEPKDVLDIVIQVDLPPSKAERIVTPAQKLLAAVGQMLDRCDSSSSSSRGRFLMEEVPNHWEKHGDLVLLPVSSFSSAEWDLLGRELWQTVAECTGSSRVAHQSIVSADGFRTPQVTLQLGDNALVQHIDNAITYEYDLTRCMFSAGNISEKLRIAGFSCAGETVVDLYAGIGYFTLPYLVHAGATHVHACEWNPDAVAALRRNLKLNCVHTRCTVHPGDNQQLTLRGVANRVNLGLIPSSEEGWSVACRVLKPTGGILHIHGNVNTQTSLGERHPERTDSERTHSLPPERTDCLWERTDYVPPKRTYSLPPERTDSLPERTDCLRERTDYVPPERTYSLPPEKTDSLPERTDCLRERTDYVPPERTDSLPPERTDSLPERTDSLPPERTNSLPERTDFLPPERTDSLPERTDCLPEKTDCLRERTDSLPERTDSLPERTDSLPPERTDCLQERKDSLPPKITDSLTERTDSLPKRTDSLRERIDSLPPERTDYVPERTDSLPSERTDSLTPERTDSLPEKTDSLPERTDSLPERTDSLTERTDSEITDSLPERTDSLTERTDSERTDSLPERTDSLTERTDSERTDSLPERTDSERTDYVPPERTNSPAHTSMIPPGTQEQRSFPKPCGKESSFSSKTAAWQKWGEGVCRTLESLLEKEHGGCWRACVLHIENVKSYAPHINHLVLDVRCTPDNPP